ncbi:unnamed protein product [Toxocara canis]|uniref:Transposase n=1 Tax=Toxocara canis TaxID=6265 RepID=A0A183U2I4_TOXCA|nr:unnamed protein product [Toxocara canis]
MANTLVWCATATDSLLRVEAPRGNCHELATSSLRIRDVDEAIWTYKAHVKLVRLSTGRRTAAQAADTIAMLLLS